MDVNTSVTRIVDAATGADRTPVEGHRGRLAVLALSPDGRLVASGDQEGEVRIYDLARGDTTWVQEHVGWVRGAEFGRDGRTLWTAGSDGFVRRWSLATGSEEARWQANVDRDGLVGARDGARRLVICGEGIQLWSDRAATPVLWSWSAGGRGHEMAFSDAEARVVVAYIADSDDEGESWTLVTLDAATGLEDSAPEVMPGWLIDLLPTDGGPLLVSCVDERLVVREGFGARREVAARDASGAVMVIAVSADGRWMALADEERVELWSLAPTARCVARVRPAGELDAIARLALSHDGGLLVVGTVCGVVAVYTRTGGDVTS